MFSECFIMIKNLLSNEKKNYLNVKRIINFSLVYVVLVNIVDFFN